MSHSPKIALLGFLPWEDPTRRVSVRENPSVLVAEECARQLGASFVSVPVSEAGIVAAIETVRSLESEIVVALGQTSTEPRVERFGRVPMASSPAHAEEEAPWLLAPDADDLVSALNAFSDPEAEAEPFRVSEDAGAYYCDHLCVELGRDIRIRGTHARFLHLTAIDGCSPRVRTARLRQYVRQTLAAIEWLRQRPAGGV